MNRTRAMLLSGTLILAILACGGGSPTNTPERSALETVVAATLTASAPSEPEEKSATEPPATDTLEPPASATVRHIVYRDGDEIRKIEAADSPTLLTAAENVERIWISDDGLKVVYARRASPESPVEVHSMNFDGSGEMTLLTPAELDALYPLEDFLHRDLSRMAFIPGTHRLLFNTRAIFDGPGLFKYDDILSLDADTGEMTEILAPGAGGDFTISPDGGTMAIVRPDSISLAVVDGSGLRPELVTYSPVITYSEFMYYVQPVWKPDGSAVGVVIPSEDPLADATHGTVWRIPADSGPAESLGPVAGEFYFSQSSSTTLLSPDLNRLAFRRETATINIYDLLISNADGSAENIYATGGIQWHGWAPDSTHFAYTQDGPMDLYVGELGQPPQPVGVCTQLRWMNADSFLCLSGSRGAWSLMDGGVDGSLSTLASPEGDFIAFDFSQP